MPMIQVRWRRRLQLATSPATVVVGGASVAQRRQHEQPKPRKRALSQMFSRQPQHPQHINEVPFRARENAVRGSEAARVV